MQDQFAKASVTPQQSPLRTPNLMQKLSIKTHQCNTDSTKPSNPTNKMATGIQAHTHTNTDYSSTHNPGWREAPAPHTSNHYHNNTSKHSSPRLCYHRCSVMAYKHTLADQPTQHPKQPLLMFPQDGWTITAPYITRIWKEKQCQMGIADHYPLDVIRRMAATIACGSSSSELEVWRLGITGPPNLHKHR